MPKVVDPEARRALVVEATFDVIAEGGVRAATLQNVANRAGINIGSLRHYFDDHETLLTFAMNAMIEQVTRRLEQRAAELTDELPAPRRRQLAEEMVLDLLPVTEQRRREATVWLEFCLAARTRPALQELSDASARGTRALLKRFLSRRRASGKPLSPAAVTLEVDRLTALVDGLAFDAVLHPSRLTASRQRAAVRAALDDLEERLSHRAGS